MLLISLAQSDGLCSTFQLFSRAPVQKVCHSFSLVSDSLKMLLLGSHLGKTLAALSFIVNLILNPLIFDLVHLFLI